MKAPPEETETLLAYLRGELEAEVATALEDRLKTNGDLRRILLELSTEEAALTDWAQAERASVALDDQTFATVRAGMKPGPGSFRGRSLAGWWAAAAMLVLSATGFLALNRQTAEPDAPLGVANLVASVDAVWAGAEPTLNHPMRPGSYQLSQGSIGMLFTDGARVRVSGPARFELRSGRHIHLEGGNLVAQIPDEALGFIVTSPQSKVVDLGTEFGLSVDEAGLTDVHVLDGLVEVLSADGAALEGNAPGVMIGEGEARRFSEMQGGDSTVIPVASRAGLIGGAHSSGIGLDMLRGSVRVVDQISKNDLFEVSEGPNWIDLVLEQRAVPIAEPLTVSIAAPGSYRNFVDPQATLAAGQAVDSYLLHFRPNSFNHVSGVIRFDQPIVGILCTGSHLRQTDALFGVPSVYYPTKANDFQGLEPNGTVPAGRQKPDEIHEPDEIILSQDRTTVSIRTFAGIDRGYDQIRILTATAPAASK